MNNPLYNASTHPYFYPRPTTSIPNRSSYDQLLQKPILYSSNANNATNNINFNVNNISIYRPPSSNRFQSPSFSLTKPIIPFKPSTQKHQTQRRSASLYQEQPTTLKTQNEYYNNKPNFNNNNINSLSQSPTKSLNDKYFSPIYPNITTLPLFKQISLQSNNINETALDTNFQYPSTSQEYFLPPKTKKYPKKTLVLDLDETLVHSSFKPFPFTADISLNIKVDTNIHNVNVLKRPYVNEFLSRMSLFYELVIFTASVAPYANPLLDILDKGKVISHRLFRQHCVYTSGVYIKNLRKVGRDMKNMIILDNNPISYVFNKENGIPILTWKSDRNDKELLRIMPFLEYLSKVDDVREVIKQVVKNNVIDYNEVNRLIQSDSNKNAKNNNNININIVNQFVSNIFLNNGNKENNNANQQLKTNQDNINVYRSNLTGINSDKDKEKEGDKKSLYFYHNKTNDNHPITINNNQNNSTLNYMPNKRNTNNNMFQVDSSQTASLYRPATSFLSKSYSYKYRDIIPPKTEVNFYYPSHMKVSPQINQNVPSNQNIPNQKAYSNYTKIMQDMKLLIEKDKVNPIPKPISKSFYWQEQENNLNLASRNQRCQTPIHHNGQLNNIKEIKNNSFINNNTNIQSSEIDSKRPLRNASSMTVRNNNYYQLPIHMEYNLI